MSGIQSKHSYNKAAVAVLEEELPDEKRAACLIMIRRQVVKGEEVALSEDEHRTAEEEKQAQLLAAVVGLGGEGRAWKSDPFTEVMNLLLPAWSPLRKGLGGEKK